MRKRTFSETAAVFLVFFLMCSAMPPLAHAQKVSSPAVTSTIADDSFQIQSDDKGAYKNSKAVQSTIQSGGDWVLDTNYSLQSDRSVWLDLSNPVAGTGPNGTPAPPFASELVKARLITQCPIYDNSMWSVPVPSVAPSGEITYSSITCGLVIHIPYAGNSYRLAMNPQGVNGYGETDVVKVTCLGAGNGQCNHWSITPTGASGMNKARLILLGPRGKTLADLGDFYVSFAIDVAYP